MQHGTRPIWHRSNYLEMSWRRRRSPRARARAHVSRMTIILSRSFRSVTLYYYVYVMCLRGIFFCVLFFSSTRFITASARLLYNPPEIRFESWRRQRRRAKRRSVHRVSFKRVLYSMLFNQLSAARFIGLASGIELAIIHVEKRVRFLMGEKNSNRFIVINSFRSKV